MKFANVDGRMAVLGPEGTADLEAASGGRLPSDPSDVIDRWDEVVETARDLDIDEWHPLDERSLRSPIPAPRQSIGVGLNYRAHALEGGWDIPEIPLIFSKLPGALSAPYADVELPSDAVDWEVELVVVIGRHTDRVDESDALASVAGYAVGQDFSERKVQRSRPGPQLTLAKSFRTFGPWGPAITTLDELEDPNDLTISCDLNGDRVQNSRTSDLIFAVPELVAFLSARLPLYPGDLIFTGTPSGVGSVRQPPRYLGDGDVVSSHIEGLGSIRNRCRTASLR